ncbi:MAG TPA: helicase HerA-like domain-containing protein [Microlunatus sp.]|nr:helicase HerA-like domain-containing protein [Microlunatus sp.]
MTESPGPAQDTAASGPQATLPPEVAEIQAGYTFEEPAIDLGVLMEDDNPLPEVRIRIPLSMLNRHGLVAGATGTGKTKTLQVLTEAMSAAGIPVFAADIKGDLSGLAAPGATNDKLAARTAKIGQEWEPRASPVEFYCLGKGDVGVPLRATVSSFGPILLAKVLGLNKTQESSLGLIFHYADVAGLPLLDLADLRSVLNHLTSEEGKEELKEIGGLSSTTVGVILRTLITFAGQGAEDFFGEPEFDTADLLRVTADGRGVVSLLELPNLASQPALFSTFLMWVLADLFGDLPEVGDVEKPKLVFFFDEAHLLFTGASPAFLQAITQTVRLIRSKGVGIFFVTQTPEDVPDDVLAQLGSRVQHQLRAHTPNDAKALKQAVATFPKSHYDLAEALQSLGIGEAIVTVMDPDGAPTPVAWTRMLAPESLMDAISADDLRPGIAQSSMMSKYGTEIDRDSAYEMLTRKLEAGAVAAEQERMARDAAEQQAQFEKRQQAAATQAEKERIAAEKQAAKERAEAERRAVAEARERERQEAAAAREAQRRAAAEAREAERRRKSTVGMVTKVLTSATTARIVRGIFGTARRR